MRGTALGAPWCLAGRRRGLRAIPATFFRQPTLGIARRLLGARLVVRDQGSRCSGRIVEVEAYHQDGDPASHSFHGRTDRNAVMFGPPGRLYVYFTYGMHFCMNVVTEAGGIGAAVLIRAVEPLEGIPVMQERRGAGVRLVDLTNGPAKCCQAFGIDLRHNGLPLTGPAITLVPGDEIDDVQVGISPRIGIRQGRDLPWRFHIIGSPWVSRPRRSAVCVPA